MSYRLIVSPIASKNIENAVEYYINKAGKKIASHYLKDFQKTYNALKINPFSQFHDNNYRYLPFSKFPYVVFFIIDEKNKKVFINAVFHTSQNSTKHPLS